MGGGVSANFNSQIQRRNKVYSFKGVSLEGRPLYLDSQATTAVDPRVLDAMLPVLTEQFGNPHSTTHMYGWENSKQVEQAREVYSSHLLSAHSSLLIV
jgi:selenocysteine lyase/cysteine desulfurase